jgi:subtilisin family serine protease
MPVPFCATDPAGCVHGTHVAGIAAGRSYMTGIPANTPPAGVQGVAPSANLAALNVFSFDQARVKDPTAFAEDILAALQAVVDNTDSRSTSNPFTVNMSLGGRNPANGAFANAPCDGWSDFTAIASAIRALYSRGIPVIASTGNESQSTAMAAPACLSKVIKVSSTLNDGVGTTRANSANVAAPSQFPGETMWFAPGGDLHQGTSITSSVPYSGYNTKFAALTGTSQAAPHIAGLYALAKGYMPPGQPAWTVDGVTAYFAANAAVPVKVNPCTTWMGPPACPYQPYQINAIRLP